jgi:hypothetical protein
VTQVTDVKPLLTVATYLDKNEAFEAYQEVSGAHTHHAPGTCYPDRNGVTLHDGDMALSTCMGHVACKQSRDEHLLC